jgi:diacylglycerol kinase (CTP)
MCNEQPPVKYHETTNLPLSLHPSYHSRLPVLTTVASPPPTTSDDARLPDEYASDPALVARIPDAHVEATTAADLVYHHHDRTPPHPQHTAHSALWTPYSSIAYFYARARCELTGLIRPSPLPSFPACWRQAMDSSRQYQVPHTPRVISPSPTPSELSGKDGYFGPTTRSAARKQRVQSPPPIDEDSSGSDPEKRARARSRSPILAGRRRRMSGLTAKRHLNGSVKSKKADLALPNGTVNGHLSPESANKNYWREMSRSPSPLGLIPIHQKWRSFVRLHATLTGDSPANEPPDPPP